MDNSEVCSNTVDEQLFDGVWVVVTTTIKTYIGRIDEISETKLHLGSEVSTEIPEVKLFPAFEFAVHTMTVPVIDPETRKPMNGPDGMPAVGVRRMPFCSLPDFCTYPVPVYLRPAQKYYFKDMKEVDRNLYKTFVRQALAQAEAERLQKAGMHAPTAKERAAFGKGGNRA